VAWSYENVESSSVKGGEVTRLSRFPLPRAQTHERMIFEHTFPQGLTLHFVVLSFDRYSRDDVIGEVMVELDDLDLSASDHEPVAIDREITPRSFKVSEPPELHAEFKSWTWRDMCASVPFSPQPKHTLGRRNCFRPWWALEKEVLRGNGKRGKRMEGNVLISSLHAFQLRTQGRGELLVSLCYQPAANRVTVVVLKARNLPKMDITGLSGEEWVTI